MMGLLNKIFKPFLKNVKYQDYFKLLNGYTPVFTTFKGGIYESELCRASIDALARHISKFRVTINGSAQPKLQTKLTKAPNEFSVWSQFLYRLANIYYTDNTAFIVPVINRLGETEGVYPIAPYKWELLNVENEPWIRFYFENNDRMAIELKRVGIMVRHQYKNDFFGEDNRAMHDTMQLINIQRQGISESAKNAATYRFMALVSNFSLTDDLKKEREKFNAQAFESGGGGVLLFPNTYKDIKQINQQTFAIDPKQSELIQENVFSYFGVNLSVLQNKCFGDEFSAFYEGALEPFAIQLSEIMTRMLFSDREVGCKAEIFFSTNRLQFMTNADKLNVSTQMVDRGLMTRNEARDIWNLPPVEGGDECIIRGEYYSADEKINSTPGTDGGDVTDTNITEGENNE